MSEQPDYFSVFGLSPSFDIDLADLEKRYFIAQREFHPDRMVSKSTQARTLAISRSMLLNSAYETLQSPLRRAQYLLLLQGVKSDAIKPSQELLIETMELREQLAEAQAASELSVLESRTEAGKVNVITQICQAFQENRYLMAGELAIRLSYLSKMADEIRVKKKNLPR